MKRRWPQEFVPDGMTPEEAIEHWKDELRKQSDSDVIRNKIRGCQRLADGSPPYYVAGIDASLTNTGVVIGDGEDHWFWRSFASETRGTEIGPRIRRCESIAGHIWEFVNQYAPIVIFIEDYARQVMIKDNRQKRNGEQAWRVSPATIALAEFGGIIRYCLLDVGQIVEVNIMHLKQFVTGNHMAKKAEIKKSIDAKYKVPFGRDDDAYDAFGLFLIGLCSLGIELPKDDKQIKVMSKLGFKLADSLEPVS